MNHPVYVYICYLGTEKSFQSFSLPTVEHLCILPSSSTDKHILMLVQTVMQKIDIIFHASYPPSLNIIVRLILNGNDIFCLDT